MGKTAVSSRQLLGLCIMVGVVHAVAYAQNPTQSTVRATPDLSSILEQMRIAKANTRPSPPYQVIREYRLFGDQASHASSDVTAKIDYLPPDHKSFVIQKRVGSSRGEDIVRRILQHEVEMSQAKHWAEDMIDSNNYSVDYLGEAVLDGNPCILLGLNPKRRASELVRGKAWVDARSFLVRRLEGQMAKSPSWMVKRVDLKLDFHDVGGAWLQTGMEAVAEVRLFGNQTLKADTIDAHVTGLTAQVAPQGRVTANPTSKRDNPPSLVVAPDRQR